MKFEFHVGDYVETIGGVVGWISAMRGDEYIIVVDKNNNTCGYYMPQERRYFVRIGQYDFTKKDGDKIEPFQVNTALTEYASIFALSDKINELVEAVNRLEEKVNEMAQD